MQVLSQPEVSERREYVEGMSDGHDEHIRRLTVLAIIRQIRDMAKNQRREIQSVGIDSGVIEDRAEVIENIANRLESQLELCVGIGFIADENKQGEHDNSNTGRTSDATGGPS